MKNRLTATLCAISLLPTAVSAQLESNIVITDAVESYKLMPNKSGNEIVEIKQIKDYTFMATRAPGTAIDYVFYDNHTRVNKASVKAKGVKPVYQSAISAGIFYDDSKVCSVTVPLEEVNKPVKTHFELTNSRPDLEPLLYIGDSYPIKNGRIIITMPIAFKDRYDIATANLTDNISINRSPSPDNRDWVITISIKDMPKLEAPDDAPPSRHIFPTVQFIGRFATPVQLYNHLREFTVEPDPAPQIVDEKAREITANINDDIERARAIFEWVNSNIRYVAIEHGDLGHKPDHASQVLSKRFGDCKGSANLIKAMLRAVGLDGRLVWIGTDNIPDDYTDRPVFATGNHMIAALKLPGDSIIYLDGTVGLADFGIYSQSIQGKQTIIEDGDNCIVGRVPVLPPTVTTDSTVLKLTVNPDNTLSGTFTETISGGYKSSFLNTLRETSPHERNRYIDNYITSRRQSWKQTNPIFTNDKPGDGPTVITSDISVSRALKSVGNKSYLTLDMAPWLSNLIFDTKERRYAGWISQRRHVVTRYDVTLPSDVAPTDIPQQVDIDNNWISANISCCYEPETRCLSTFLQFTVKERLIPLEDIDAYNADIRHINNAANTAFTLNTPQ